MFSQHHNGSVWRNVNVFFFLFSLYNKSEDWQKKTEHEQECSWSRLVRKADPRNRSWFKSKLKHLLAFSRRSPLSTLVSAELPPLLPQCASSSVCCSERPLQLILNQSSWRVIRPKTSTLATGLSNCHPFWWKCFILLLSEARLWSCEEMSCMLHGYFVMEM